MDSFTRYAMRQERPEVRPLTFWDSVKVALAFAAFIVLSHLDLIIWGQ